jgi:hypothetical protein
MKLDVIYQEDNEFINSLDYILLIGERIISPVENWTNNINIYKR